MIKAILSEVSDEANDIKSFSFMLRDHISPKPGQFVMVAFPDQPDVKRSFSIVDYRDRKLRIVAKKKGIFTQRLFGSSRLENMLIYGPYGHFIFQEMGATLVYIAGGIGITPIYPMLRAASQRGEDDVYLFYSGKKKEDMALIRELSELNPRIRKEYIYTSIGGRRIDAGYIQSIVDGFESAVYYICGPDEMIEDLRGQLEGAGVPGSSIRSESFSQGR